MEAERSKIKVKMRVNYPICQQIKTVITTVYLLTMTPRTIPFTAKILTYQPCQCHGIPQRNRLRPPVAPRQQTVSFQQQQQQQPPPPPQQEIPAHVLPSLAIQSLAAENAMEKLSKEIVYLRNQQRIALKDRRLEALAKKKRAEERRQQHKQDLFGARQEVATLQVEKETLEEKVRVLELTVLGAEESKALMSEALKANQVVLGEQQQAMEQMRTEISSGAELLSRREAEWTVKEADLAAKMEAMRAALVKAELHVSVMAKSNEAAEERSVHCSAEDTMLRVQAIISHQLNVNSYCYLCSALVCDCC